MRATILVAPLLAANCMAAGVVSAQQSTAEGIAEYREMLADGNPAELVEAQGEELWKQARGPRNATLAQCDFGLGAGVIKGVYAQMPRYFKDAGRVMDFETRLVYCMETLQGYSRDALIKKPFSEQGERATDIEVLTAYAAAQSRGAKIEVPQKHKEEKAAYARGEKIFYYRAGPYDFGCVTCHGKEAQRIRLQDLPNLTRAEDARKAFAAWPAYRLSQGAVRTMEWRIADCFRQQRFPELIYGSPAAVDLITYLGVKANGGVMDAPGLKR